MLKLIWAQTEEGVIGKGNRLPWHIPEELRHFKAATSNHTIVMGRKTYESIGKPLPNRKNIVISRDSGLKIPGVEVVNSIKSIIEKSKTDDIFIIGGKQIYDLFLPYADELIITFIKFKYPGDTILSYNMKDFKISDTDDYEKFTIKKFVRKE